MRTTTITLYTIAELSPNATNCAINLVVGIMDGKKITKQQIHEADIEFFNTGALYSDEDYVYNKLSKIN